MLEPQLTQSAVTDLEQKPKTIPSIPKNQPQDPPADNNAPDNRAFSIAKITTEGIGHSFVSPSEPKITALVNVNLEIYEQEFVAIVGPSGCGKSTLLNILSGLIPPSTGKVFFNGEPMTGVNQKIGYMSQADSLMPWRTTIENIELSLEIKGIPSRQRREISQRLIDTAGLSGFENRYPHELSGGMKKRVVMMRLLAADNEVFFMDEPFGALDVFTREMLQDEILKMWQSTKKTILFVTHDLAEAITLADRVVLLTARPSTIKTEYRIPLSRPRSALETRFQADFVELHKTIWNDLKTEVITSSGERDA